MEPSRPSSVGSLLVLQWSEEHTFDTIASVSRTPCIRMHNLHHGSLTPPVGINRPQPFSRRKRPKKPFESCWPLRWRLSILWTARPPAMRELSVPPLGLGGTPASKRRQGPAFDGTSSGYYERPVLLGELGPGSSSLR